MIHAILYLISKMPERLRRMIVRGFMEVIWSYFTRQRVYGKENIPAGPCLFICNHLSNADGYTLQRAFRPRRVFFLAGVKLQDTLQTRIAAEAVETIPIKPNSADLEALKRAVETLKNGHSVLIFPEGGRSRTGSLIQAKKGVAMIAKRAGVPVVPIALTGTEKFLPINDDDMNSEKPHKAETVVRFGKPFSIDSLQVEAGEEDARQALVDAMMRKVAELLPLAYRGVYK